MKKFLKWFISMAAVGSAIGLIIAYLCKSKCCDSCVDDSQDFDDEDFDLDSDLQPASDREYVPLKRTAETASGNKAEDDVSEKKQSEDIPTEDNE